MRKLSYFKSLMGVGALSLLATAASAEYNTPVLDGVGIDTDNYTLLSLQTEPDSGFGGTGLLQGIYMSNDDTNLYIGIAGNLSGNGAMLFLDVEAGGVTEVGTDADNPFGDFNDLANAGAGNLPNGFDMDYAFALNESGGNLFVSRWDVDNAGNDAEFLGSSGGGLTESVAAANAFSVDTDTGLELSVPLATLGIAPGDTIQSFVYSLGGGSPRFVAGQFLPPNVGGGGANLGTGSGGNGISFDGTDGGPSIRPLNYRLATAPDPLEELVFDAVVTGVDLGNNARGWRGLEYDANGDNWVIGSTAGNVFVVSSDLSTTSVITGTGTGDSVLSQYELGVSSDGYIYTNGFAGSVKLVGPVGTVDASGNGLIVNATTDYSSITLGASRSMKVVGSHSDGTATVFVGKGTGIGVFVNDPNTTGTYTLATEILGATPGEQGSIEVNPSGTEVFAYDAGNNPAVFKFVGTPEAGYTLASDTPGASYGNFESGMAIDFDAGDVYIGGGHSSTGDVGDTRIASSILATAGAIGDGAQEAGGATNLAGFYTYGGAADGDEGEVAFNPVGAQVAIVNNGASSASAGQHLVIWNAVPDTTAPTVEVPLTVQNAEDPTTDTTIVFTVDLSDEEIINFDSTGIDLSSSTAPGTLVATIVSGGVGTNFIYTIEVTGMTGAGTVQADLVPANITDRAGLALNGTGSDSIGYDPNAKVEDWTVLGDY